MRCPWTSNDPLMIKYHDEEWGKPVHDDKKLFEISQNAYEIANKYHTWENRVDTILDMVKLSKLMDK